MIPAKKKRQRRLTKERVASWLQGRFLLRVHMSLILVGTFLAGLAATKLFLMIGVSSLALRYVAAVIAAYLVFLLLIRLWLFYIGLDRRVDFTGDGVDLLGNIHFSPGDASFDAGGGSFGGGGASGAWGDSGVDAAAAPLKSSASKSSGGIGDLFSFDVDAGELVVLILFLALVASLLSIGIYLIYTAPVLLSEAAFEALLAAALLKRAKKIDRPGWVGRVWKATFWPFLGTVLLAGLLGWAAKRACPEATRLRDVFDCPSRAQRPGSGASASLKGSKSQSLKGDRRPSTASPLRPRDAATLRHCDLRTNFGHFHCLNGSLTATPADPTPTYLFAREGPRVRLLFSYRGRRPRSSVARHELSAARIRTIPVRMGAPRSPAAWASRL